MVVVVMGIGLKGLNNTKFKYKCYNHNGYIKLIVFSHRLKTGELECRDNYKKKNSSSSSLAQQPLSVKACLYH